MLHPTTPPTSKEKKEKKKEKFCLLYLNKMIYKDKLMLPSYGLFFACLIGCGMIEVLRTVRELLRSLSRYFSILCIVGQ
jgi:hypothetical protein